MIAAMIIPLIASSCIYAVSGPKVNLRSNGKPPRYCILLEKKKSKASKDKQTF